MRGVAAAVAVSLLLALPAAAGAAGKGIRIDPSADPLAPSGQTPMVLFHVTGLSKGHRYQLSAVQKSGQDPYRDGAFGPEQVCDPGLGSPKLKRAKKSSLDWDTRPRFFFSEPELIESSYGGWAPCKGRYEGELRVKERFGASTLIRFSLTVPGLKMRYRR